MNMKRRALTLVGAAVLAGPLAAAAVAGPAAADGSDVVYDAVPDPLPASMISYGFEATSMDELGDHIAFADGATDLDSVTVSMVNWACEEGHHGTDDCATTPGATFDHDITVNLYESDPTATTHVGDLITSVTQTVAVPFRPSVDPNCDGGKWQASDGNCHNGFAFPVEFDLGGVSVPDEIIFGVAFDTEHHGNDPIGVDGPYDSLNVGLVETAPTVGTDVDPDVLFYDSSQNYYTDGGAAGLDVFRFDTGSSYTVAARFTAVAPETTPVDPPVDPPTTPVTPPTTTPVPGGGYFLVEADGDLYGFGSARATLRSIDPSAREDAARGATISDVVRSHARGTDAVAIESTADGKGLWVLLADGRIVDLGNARSAGGATAAAMPKAVAGQDERPVALARLATGDLWVFTSAGRILPQFGQLPATAHAAMTEVLSLELAGPVLDAKPTSDGAGAYAIGSDGGVFAYNAPFHGSLPGVLAANGRSLPEQPVTGVTTDPDGSGYWLVAEDGGVFAFDAAFHGALPAVVPFDQLAAPVTGMMPFGDGYVLTAGDGGVFNFSGLPFSGSAAGLVDTTVVGVVTI